MTATDDRAPAAWREPLPQGAGERDAGPRVFDTSDERPVMPPADLLPAPAGVARDRPPRRLMLGGVGLAGVLGVWTADWLLALFERAPLLGAAAAAAVGLIVFAVGGWVWREWRALSRLRTVGLVRAELSAPAAPAELAARLHRGAALLELAHAYREPVAAWRRSFQAEHDPTTMARVFETAVLAAPDRAARRAVRRAAAQGFGLVAISPTPLTDVLLMVARMLRLLREVSAAYGYRPGSAATWVLLRGVLRDAALVTATEFTLEGLARHSGGNPVSAVLRPVAEGAVAAQRTARFGLLVMEHCRPMAFSADRRPRLSELLTGLRD